MGPGGCCGAHVARGAAGGAEPGGSGTERLCQTLQHLEAPGSLTKPVLEILSSQSS